MNIMQNKNDSAKITFLYLTHTISLMFVCFAGLAAIFQIINKIYGYHTDLFSDYSPDDLKMAVAILLVSGPLYFLSFYAIDQKIIKGEIQDNCAIRKWFIWFIIFFFLIAASFFTVNLIYSYLCGEFSIKFLLQSFGAVFIALMITAHYFVDIKRKSIQEIKNRWTKIYFYVFLQIIILIVFGAFFLLDNPWKLKNKIHDSQIIEDLSWLEEKITSYHEMNNDVPGSLNILTQNEVYNTDEDAVRSPDNEIYGYNKISSSTYELCAAFKTSNLEEGGDKTTDWRYNDYYNVEHAAGEQCFFYKVKRQIDTGDEE